MKIDIKVYSVQSKFSETATHFWTKISVVKFHKMLFLKICQR